MGIVPFHEIFFWVGGENGTVVEVQRVNDIPLWESCRIFLLRTFLMWWWYL